MTQSRFLVFELSGQLFCVNAFHVVEVIDIPSITSVPLSEKHTVGVLNFRGDVVTVTDLGAYLELSKTNSKGKIIIVSNNSQKHGFLVDQVSKIEDIDIFDSPESFSVNMKYLSGIFNDSRNIISLLDLNKLLTSLVG